MHGDHHVIFPEAHRLRGLLIIDFSHDLHLEVMVSRTECAHLAVLALFCRVRNMVRLRAVDPAVLLDICQVFLHAVALPKGPLRATEQHLVDLSSREFDKPLGAQTGRHTTEEIIHKRLEPGHNLLPRHAGLHGPHAAGNIETYSAHGDDATFVRIERRYAAYWKTVAPVRIRHGDRCDLNARKHRDVRDLFANLFVHFPDQFLARKYPAGNTHFTLLRNLPEVVVDLMYCFEVHMIPPANQTNFKWCADPNSKYQISDYK